MKRTLLILALGILAAGCGPDVKPDPPFVYRVSVTREGKGSVTATGDLATFSFDWKIDGATPADIKLAERHVERIAKERAVLIAAFSQALPGLMKKVVEAAMKGLVP